MSTPARWRCALLAAATLAGCRRGEAGPVSLGESDAGRHVTVDVGEEVLVTLPANRTTGFRWLVRDSALPALRLEGDAEYLQDSTRARLTGVPGVETFRFTAVEPGRASLRLDYARPWETSVAPAREFRVEVTAR